MCKFELDYKGKSEFLEVAGHHLESSLICIDDATHPKRKYLGFSIQASMLNSLNYLLHKEIGEFLIV